MMSVYDVPSTTPTGRCGILSVMAPIFSSVSSRLSYACRLAVACRTSGHVGPWPESPSEVRAVTV